VRTIAFFDFDGTITTKDSLLEFIKFCKGRMNFYKGFLLNSPYLIAYKAGIITNQRAKEKVLAHFFKNTTLADFNLMAERFTQEVLPGLIRPGALAEIASLQQKGAEIVIVSASPGNWIKPWATQMSVSLIATNLVAEEGKITGIINGKNCYGEEKVNRIKQLYDLTGYDTIYAYGDSSGDQPMLALAGKPFYKPFR
jgi:phosphatidylglycerophosphatase C